MVSGLVTSPWDQLRIFSGEAREMRIESKSAIKFARSYGEDLKIASNYPKTLGPRMHTSEHELKQNSFVRIRLHSWPVSFLSQPPAPCRRFRAASSSAPHPGRATATPESI